MSRIPQARLATSIPRVVNTFASEPPPVDRVGQTRPSARAAVRDQPDDGRVVGNAQPFVLPLHLRLDPRPVLPPLERDGMASRRLLEARAHVLGLGGELGLGQAAGLAANGHLARHDIGGEPAVHDAQVGGGLGVHAAQPHPRDGLARHLDGADAALGTDPRVRLEPVDREGQAVGGGGAA